MKRKTWAGGLILIILALALLPLLLRHRVPPAPSARVPVSSPAPVLEPPAPSATSGVGAVVQAPNPMRERAKRVRESVVNMSAEERAQFEKKFEERIKPEVDRWCKVYAGHLPFRAEDVTADKLREVAGSRSQGYSFVIDGTTLGVFDDHGKMRVDYLMSGAANDLFRMPTNPAPPEPMSVEKAEIMRLLKEDSGGTEFPPDQVAIRPASAAGAMNGGVSVDVGVGVNAPYMVFTDLRFGMVFDPNGKLACYLRGLGRQGP